MDYLYTEPLPMPRATHYGNNYWIFRSRKLGRRVTAFSNLEYWNLLCLEMDPEVVHYCEQPCEQSVIIDGERHKTVFDVYVVYRDGREEFQEVKYSEELNSDTKQGERSRRQVEVQKYWCMQNNFGYSLRTDKEIEIGQYTVRNLSFLCAKARRFSSCSVVDDGSVIRFLKERGCVTIGQLYGSGRITEKNGLDYLADLCYRGVIKFVDIGSTAIGNATEVMLYGM
ncbi:MAG: TnsA endonuclease N-terminal domain-containing protein [Lachnospiraceae bacterium]|nr:TnsA endonuclease N-terminal domain-containing protein [Lachnospiraceae bacterium]